MVYLSYFSFFFFKQKTAYEMRISDWSSDVCSSDLAVALANDTDYGLNASVWGGDLDNAIRVGRRIQSGNVNINDILATAYASKGTPSGGVKQSGVGARHGDQGLLSTPTARDRKSTRLNSSH